jgi:integrase
MPTLALTAKNVATATSSGKPYDIHWDDKLRGFGLKVMLSGHKSFLFQYRVKGKSDPRKKLSDNLEEARKEARALQVQIDKGRDPIAEEKQALAEVTTFGSVTEQYLKIVERKGDMRSFPKRERVLRKHVLPVFGDRNIADVKRTDIHRLIDKIVERGHNVLALDVLVAICAVMKHHALRTDGFNSPCIPGMGSQIPRNKARERVLSDSELALVWRAADDQAGPYGRLLQFLLLTAARLNEAAQMKWSELSDDGSLWTIPVDRYKTKITLEVPLSAMARQALTHIREMNAPEYVKASPYAFTFTGRVPMSGWNMFKQRFDERTAALAGAPLPEWTHHDLRRSARSLMARIGVPDHIAELCLGHKQPGIQATYNKHPYQEEKRQAFEALAAEIQRILYPQPAKVVRMKRRR